MKGAIGKTKGTEHRITVATPKREFELGCDDKNLAEGWITDLQQWIGVPKVRQLACLTSTSCCRAAVALRTLVCFVWIRPRICLLIICMCATQVERLQLKAAEGQEKVVKSQWMEARIVVYTPDEICAGIKIDAENAACTDAHVCFALAIGPRSG